MRSNEPGRLERVVMLARAYPGRALLVLAVAGVGAYLLAVHLIPSRTGEVRAVIEQVRSGILDGNAEEVLDRISPYFYEEGIDKPALAGYLQRALADRPVRQLTIILRQIEFQDDAATVDISVRSLQGRRRLPTDWSISLEKIDGRWLVRRAAPTSIAGYRSVGFRELLRMY